MIEFDYVKVEGNGKKELVLIILKKIVDFFPRGVSFLMKLDYFCTAQRAKQPEEWQSWFNALVLKTSVPLRVPGVRIPPPPQLLWWV